MEPHRQHRAKNSALGWDLPPQPMGHVPPWAVLYQCTLNGFSHSGEACTQTELSAVEMCAMSVLCPMLIEATTAVSQPQLSVLPLLGREGGHMLKLMLTGKEKVRGNSRKRGLGYQQAWEPFFLTEVLPIRL